MNTSQENLEFILNSVKYSGFGERPELQEAIRKGFLSNQTEFTVKDSTTLKLDQVKGDSNEKDKGPKEGIIHSELSFRRSDTTGLVFFNKYQASVPNEKDPEKTRSQTFYLSKGSGVTLKEAYNLLEGRAVKKDLTNKDGKEYSAWIKLNFNEKDAGGNYKVQQYSQGYGYDLNTQMKDLPLQLKYNDSLANITKSLEKGNSTLVTYEHAGKSQQGFIAANPQYKTINESKELRQFRSAMELDKKEGQTQSEDKGKKQDDRVSKSSKKDKEAVSERENEPAQKTRRNK